MPKSQHTKFVFMARYQESLSCLNLKLGFWFIYTSNLIHVFIIDLWKILYSSYWFEVCYQSFSSSCIQHGCIPIHIFCLIGYVNYWVPYVVNLEYCVTYHVLDKMLKRTINLTLMFKTSTLYFFLIYRMNWNWNVFEIWN